MTKVRLEAFSDGVIAIIITIMVLEIKVPHEASFHALHPMLPTLLAYLLSFIFVGIYWVNHHHLLHIATRINGKVLWANLHLLFWLSLIPVTTEWLGEHPGAPDPVVVYGIVLAMNATASGILVRTLSKVHGQAAHFAALSGGKPAKIWISTALNLAALPLAYVSPLISFAMYVAVAVVWIVPDKDVEAHFAEPAGKEH